MNMFDWVYRIMPAREWEHIQNFPEYVPKELETDGFIHLSYLHQVIEVANFLDEGQHDLLLVQIATAKLTDLRSEDLYGYEQEFPHLYGPLPLDAVQGVHSLIWNQATFELPETLPPS